MGKWNNHRWRPRNNHRYESLDFSLPHQYHSLTSDDWKGNAPLWEKEFCLKVGSLPWKRILVAKKYMHCHDGVVKWNDSGSEEAFNNAKKRFRAGIDGLPCDIPSPDPNMYVDEIDWNPDIDPELIVELEKEYFNPDEGEKIKKIKTIEQITHCYNPWQHSIFKATEAAMKDVAQSRNPWDDLTGKESNKKKNNAVENPWEQNQIHVKGEATNDNAWLSSNDKPWGWNQKGQDERLRSNNVDSQCGWQNHGSAKEAAWCSSGNKYRVQNQMHNDRSWDWRQQRGQNNYREPLNYCTDSGVMGGGWWRKREGSYQHSSRHKSPRFHGDGCIGNRH